MTRLGAPRRESGSVVDECGFARQDAEVVLQRMRDQASIDRPVDHQRAFIDGEARRTMSFMTA